MVGVQVRQEDVASRSARPTVRTSWRWVPSPQSMRMRSPPRRTSSAGQPAARGRHRAGGAGEEERQVHRSRDYCGAVGSPAEVADRPSRRHRSSEGRGCHPARTPVAGGGGGHGTLARSARRSTEVDRPAASDREVQINGSMIVSRRSSSRVLFVRDQSGKPLDLVDQAAALKSSGERLDDTAERRRDDDRDGAVALLHAHDGQSAERRLSMACLPTRSPAASCRPMVNKLTGGHDCSLAGQAVGRWAVAALPALAGIALVAGLTLTSPPTRSLRSTGRSTAGAGRRRRAARGRAARPGADAAIALRRLGRGAAPAPRRCGSGRARSCCATSPAAPSASSTASASASASARRRRRS